eukprot:m.8798 g.8798  ORF g.8798 m.8798 type:complete len:1805 (-) comp3959_c0_seq1:80-5494(-)
MRAVITYFILFSTLVFGEDCSNCKFGTEGPCRHVDSDTLCENYTDGTQLCPESYVPCSTSTTSTVTSISTTITKTTTTPNRNCGRAICAFGSDGPCRRNNAPTCVNYADPTLGICPFGTTPCVPILTTIGTPSPAPTTVLDTTTEGSPVSTTTIDRNCGPSVCLFGSDGPCKQNGAPTCAGFSDAVNFICPAGTTACVTVQPDTTTQPVTTQPGTTLPDTTERDTTTALNRNCGPSVCLFGADGPCSRDGAPTCVGFSDAVNFICPVGTTKCVEVSTTASQDRNCGRSVCQFGNDGPCKQDSAPTCVAYVDAQNFICPTGSTACNPVTISSPQMSTAPTFSVVVQDCTGCNSLFGSGPCKTPGRSFCQPFLDEAKLICPQGYEICNPPVIPAERMCPGCEPGTSGPCIADAGLPLCENYDNFALMTCRAGTRECFSTTTTTSLSTSFTSTTSQTTSTKTIVTTVSSSTHTSTVSTDTSLTTTQSSTSQTETSTTISRTTTTTVIPSLLVPVITLNMVELKRRRPPYTITGLKYNFEELVIENSDFDADSLDRIEWFDDHVVLVSKGVSRVKLDTIEAQLNASKDKLFVPNQIGVASVEKDYGYDAGQVACIQSFQYEYLGVDSRINCNTVANTLTKVSRYCVPHDFQLECTLENGKNLLRVTEGCQDVADALNRLIEEGTYGSVVGNIGCQGGGFLEVPAEQCTGAVDAFTFALLYSGSKAANECAFTSSSTTTVSSSTVTTTTLTTTTTSVTSSTSSSTKSSSTVTTPTITSSTLTTSTLTTTSTSLTSKTSTSVSLTTATSLTQTRSSLTTTISTVSTVSPTFSSLTLTSATTTTMSKTFTTLTSSTSSSPSRSSTTVTATTLSSSTDSSSTMTTSSSVTSISLSSTETVTSITGTKTSTTSSATSETSMTVTISSTTSTESTWTFAREAVGCRLVFQRTRLLGPEDTGSCERVAQGVNRLLDTCQAESSAVTCVEVEAGLLENRSYVLKAESSSVCLLVVDTLNELLDNIANDKRTKHTVECTAGGFIQVAPSDSCEEDVTLQDAIKLMFSGRIQTNKGGCYVVSTPTTTFTSTETSTATSTAVTEVCQMLCDGVDRPVCVNDRTFRNSCFAICATRQRGEPGACISTSATSTMTSTVTSTATITETTTETTATTVSSITTVSTSTEYTETLTSITQSSVTTITSSSKTTSTFTTIPSCPDSPLDYFVLPKDYNPIELAFILQNFDVGVCATACLDFPGDCNSFSLANGLCSLNPTEGFIFHRNIYSCLTTTATSTQTTTVTTSATTTITTTQTTTQTTTLSPCLSRTCSNDCLPQLPTGENCGWSEGRGACLPATIGNGEHTSPEELFGWYGEGCCEYSFGRTEVAPDCPTTTQTSTQSSTNTNTHTSTPSTTQTNTATTTVTFTDTSSLTTTPTSTLTSTATSTPTSSATSTQTSTVTTTATTTTTTKTSVTTVSTVTSTTSVSTTKTKTLTSTTDTSNTQTTLSATSATISSTTKTSSSTRTVTTLTTSSATSTRVRIHELKLVGLISNITLELVSEGYVNRIEEEWISLLLDRLLELEPKLDRNFLRVLLRELDISRSRRDASNVNNAVVSIRLELNSLEELQETKDSYSQEGDILNALKEAILHSLTDAVTFVQKLDPGVVEYREPLLTNVDILFGEYDVPTTTSTNATQELASDSSDDGFWTSQTIQIFAAVVGICVALLLLVAVAACYKRSSNGRQYDTDEGTGHDILSDGALALPISSYQGYEDQPYIWGPSNLDAPFNASPRSVDESSYLGLKGVSQDVKQIEGVQELNSWV